MKRMTLEQMAEQKRKVHKAYHEWRVAIGSLQFRHYLMLAYGDEINMDFCSIEIDYIERFGLRSR
jgi:hypothetical protein